MSRHPISVSGTEYVARISLEPVGLSVDVSLAPILAWWGRLRDRNQRAREADEFGPRLDDYQFVRNCPCCRADFSHLTQVHKDTDIVRVCMACRHEFR